MFGWFHDPRIWSTIWSQTIELRNAGLIFVYLLRLSNVIYSGFCFENEYIFPIQDLYEILYWELC
jgi:hypothetical protein